MATWVIAWLYSLVLIFLVSVANWRSSRMDLGDRVYEALRNCISFSLGVSAIGGYVLIFSLSN